MKHIDKQLLDDVSRQAQKSDRLRMNYNFHQSLDEKCHRFLNAVEPGTKVEIHRHPTKDESFVLLRGRVRVNTYNDDGSVDESVVLCPEEGLYGVDIPKNIWHNVESLESGSVFFECKEGPFVPHEVERLLHLSDKG
ncbi:WbuC family cupin fold metalloprotein [Xylanibacter brevis]|uniref:WbuC family cupin fold metalloprotein n=1 Tax=Xylanibacter brevis TaxID=83231 RepID=UPI000482B29A|nr:WbuC family cupin fold metalloprotein [Xylanibacter brevis]